jgi:hypothetical protein
MALQVVKELPYNRWREANVEETLLSPLLGVGLFFPQRAW